jgi:hypothetical protein
MAAITEEQPELATDMWCNADELKLCQRNATLLPVSTLPVPVIAQVVRKRLMHDEIGKKPRHLTQRLLVQ